MTGDPLALAVATWLRAREGAQVLAGTSLRAVREGYALVALEVAPDMLNGLGTVHGGILFTLADSAFAYACNSRNDAAVAQQASIVFVSPARSAETLLAEAVEQSLAGRSGVYQVTVTGADNRVVAIFQGLARRTGGKVLPDDKPIDRTVGLCDIVS